MCMFTIPYSYRVDTVLFIGILSDFISEYNNQLSFVHNKIFFVLTFPFGQGVVSIFGGSIVCGPSVVT